MQQQESQEPGVSTGSDVGNQAAPNPRPLGISAPCQLFVLGAWLCCDMGMAAAELAAMVTLHTVL